MSNVRLTALFVSTTTPAVIVPVQGKPPADRVKVTGNPQRKRHVDGVIVERSTVSATARRVRRSSGVIAEQSTAAATATVIHIYSRSGVIAGQSTISATVRRVRRVDGVIASRSTVTATPTVISHPPSVSVEQSARGDGVPIWIGIAPPPLMPTLALVGTPTQVPVRTPTHEREASQVALGTVDVRVVRINIVRHERVSVMIERGRQGGADREQCGVERGSVSGGPAEVAHASRAHARERQTAPLGELQYTSAAAPLSKRTRIVRRDHEEAGLFFTLEVDTRVSLAMGHMESARIPWATRSAELAHGHMVTQESWTMWVVSTLLYQRGVSAHEVAVLAMIVDLFDKAA